MHLFFFAAVETSFNLSQASHLQPTLSFVLVIKIETASALVWKRMSHVLKAS